VGEGSGKCCDIDPFDRYYLHLFVWDAEARAIAGAYRLGCVDEILRRHHVGGLYTHSLFRYGPGILDMLSPGLELGRSFICARYQRSFVSMLLLWRGIGRYVTSAPRRAILFGPVSISNDYSATSRELIVRYLAAHMAEDRLTAQVLPRRPFAFQPVGPAAGPRMPRSVDELSRRIADLEPDRKGVPVLLRQYLRLGARVLAFNVDRRFGDVLDGLMMLDLRLVEPALLARYMGTPGMTAFREHHGLEPQPTSLLRRPPVVRPSVAWPLAAPAIPDTGSLAAGDPIE
jgi:putative hemolysin